VLFFIIIIDIRGVQRKQFIGKTEFYLFICL